MANNLETESTANADEKVVNRNALELACAVHCCRPYTRCIDYRNWL